MLDLRLRLGRAGFQTRRLRLLHSQLALQRQRARVARASAGNHAAVVAGAFERKEIKLRIGAGQLLRRAPHFRPDTQIAASKEIALPPGRADRGIRRADRDAPRLLLWPGRISGAVCRDIEAAQGVDEEGGAAAHFVAQQRDACAGVIESFDDDVFEFFAQELLDRAFMFLFDFGVIGEQADGAETCGFRLPLVAKSFCTASAE